MKGDMAGAAAVLATFTALDAVQPPVRVRGYLPLTDNMPGGDATRVGDVLRIRNGTTVEVLNTDAEGRLVLADALALAAEDEPDAIVDLATLTGACMVALGMKIAGLMGNHRRVRRPGAGGRRRRGRADVAAAAARPRCGPTSSPRWPTSRTCRRSAGAGRRSPASSCRSSSATGIPWVHLDIAGPADSPEDDGLTRKGGTGFGVRTLLHLLSAYRKPAKSGA